ncbi:MAG: hypothetical protein MHM6MM_008669, partial [Cercozoa sp. M6MM]
MRVGFFVLLAAVLVAHVAAIQFYVKPNESKCLSDDLSNQDIVRGEYKAMPNGIGFDVTVYGPNGQVVRRDEGKEKGMFAFSGMPEGEHKVCFMNRDRVTKTVQYELETGADAKDYDSVARRENLKPLELQLRKLEDTVSIIHK